jgi:hypothetical protein
VTDIPEDLDVMYYQLILSMQAATMQHLGKVMSPVTGKIERNLDAARYSIDMLEMIQRKTVGNLTPEEQRLLEHVVHELRLNYIEEAGKSTTPEPDSEESAEGASQHSPAEGAEKRPPTDEI